MANVILPGWEEAVHRLTYFQLPARIRERWIAQDCPYCWGKSGPCSRCLGWRVLYLPPMPENFSKTLS